MRNLHASSWFSYGDLETAICVRVGGRQGCKFEATVFNSTYAVALLALRDSLLDDGIVLRMHDCNEASFFGVGVDFDAATMFDPKEKEVHALDAAFVDDEAIAILARSPLQLDKAVGQMLNHIVRICAEMWLDIKWKPGKTEAFIRYRGQGATKFLESKRRPDGSLGFPVPQSSLTVCIVDQYRHLGGVVCCDGNVQPDAVAKTTSAMSAYVPIALKVFGSPAISIALKFVFMASLVMSRLLFNVHIIVPTPRYIKTINSVYMRILRRIGNSMRFQRCEKDIEVRRRLKAPSIECVLARARLRYVRRVLSHRPKTLMALLNTRVKGNVLPWVGLVIDDMRALRHTVSLCNVLPDPACSHDDWASFILCDAKWFQAFSCFRYCEPCLEDFKVVSAVTACVTTPVVTHARHGCNQCSAVFTNRKALLAHQRTKHQQRAEQRYYSNAEGVCQVCCTQFHTHARLLQHLTDRRRTRCWSTICAELFNYNRLSEESVNELDEWYRVQKADAFKHGHSHILAKKPARTQAGKLIGRVRR